MTSYALATGQSETTSYALLAILNSTGMIGRVVPGIIADKIGRFNTLIVTTTMAVITIFAIWLPFGHTKTGLIVFLCYMGFVTVESILLHQFAVVKFAELGTTEEDMEQCTLWLHLHYLSVSLYRDL